MLTLVNDTLQETKGNFEWMLIKIGNKVCMWSQEAA